LCKCEALSSNPSAAKKKKKERNRNTTKLISPLAIKWALVTYKHSPWICHIEGEKMKLNFYHDLE
jgi:hypothetical protein